MPPPGGAYLPLVQQAGIIPLRPLQLGDILTGSFTLLRFSPRTTVGFSLLCQLAALAVVLPLLGWGLSALGSQLFEPSDEVDQVDLMSSLVGAGASLPSSLVEVVVAFVLCVVVSRAVIGERVTIGQAWREARPSFWRYVLLGLLYLLVLTLVAGVFALAWFGSHNPGFLALVALLVLPVGFVASVRLALTRSVLVLERAGVVQSLRRSWALTRGQFWRILGIQIVVSIVVGLVGGAISFPLTMLGSALGLITTTGDSTTGPLIASTVATVGAQLLVSGLTTPVSVAASTLLYVDQRMRREGLDVQLAQVVQQRLDTER